MARPRDPNLEGRILKAARKLWREEGHNSLTLREVARVARTNTPAVYRRFRNRDAILRALLQQTKQDVFQQLAAASSIEEACERYLNFALSHPHEYELYYLHEYELFFSSESKRGVTLNQLIQQRRPAVEFMKGMMAARLGGQPDDYTLTILAIWALLHGTAMLLVAKTVQPDYAAEMRAACRAAIETILREASRSPAQR
jgi:AcrR family transcriptional regulator